ncbi:pentapeptide repeat-containing protein [Nocardia sp. NBC_00565]|uniref:pentapeptide repeat-containing protein n=1 Tax=Nocardia sp. NBC_00565 TaxID=2975993 RepID=UPI003FA57B4F
MRPRLIGIDLIGIDLIGSNLIGSNLIGSNLIGSELIGSELIGSSLIGSGRSRRRICLRQGYVRTRQRLRGGRAPRAFRTPRLRPRDVSQQPWRVRSRGRCRQGLRSAGYDPLVYYRGRNGLRPIVLR